MLRVAGVHLVSCLEAALVVQWEQVGQWQRVLGWQVLWYCAPVRSSDFGG